MPEPDADGVVVRDSRPGQVVLFGFAGVVLVSWAIRRPIVGVPLLVVWAAAVVTTYRSPRNATFVSREGIAGLRVRIPKSERATWYHRHEVVASVTPWEQIEGLQTGASAVSLTGVRVRLTDGREADLGANAITRRGLRKMANDLERLRPPAA
jgi:hypothetical protein